MKKFRGLALALSAVMFFTTVDETAIRAWAEETDEQAVTFEAEQTDEQAVTFEAEQTEEQAVAVETEQIEEATETGQEYAGIDEDVPDTFQAGAGDTTGGDAEANKKKISSATFYDLDGVTVLARYETETDTLASVISSPERYILRTVHNGLMCTEWKCITKGCIYENGLYNLQYTRNHPLNGEHSFIMGVYEPHQYVIDYNLGVGGWTAEQEATLKKTYTIEDEEFFIEKPQKEGYFFEGWFLDEAFTQPIEKITSENCFDGKPGNGSLTLHLYAKFVATPTMVVPKISVENIKKSKTAVIDLDNSGIKQWVELWVSTDKNFKASKTSIVDLAPGTSELTMVPKSKATYYFRARAFIVDSTGGRFYTDPSETVKLKMKYGLTETAPTTSSGKMTKVEIQEDKTTLLVEATVSKRIKSYDELYYLAVIDPSNNKKLQIIEPIPVLKAKKLTFELSVTDEMLDKKFALFIQKSKGKYSRISAGKAIINPEKMHSDSTLPIPKVKEVENEKISKTIGDAIIRLDSVSNVDGKELCFSTDSAFSKSLNYVNLKPNETQYTLYNIPKNKTYYFRARSYVVDVSTGNLCYGDYSESVKCKMKWGVTESAVSASAGKVSSAKIKDDRKTLTVETSISKRIKSYDEFYYLVAIDPVSNACSAPIASTLKATTGGTKKQSFTFEVPVRDEKGTNLIQKKFALAVQTSKGKYSRVSAGKFITNPEKAAAYTEPFPTTSSKKGIQGLVEDGVGTNHNFWNFNLDEVLVGGDIPYEYNGKTYKFRDPFAYNVMYANDRGITVTAQINMHWMNDKQYMILASGRQSGHRLYAINAQEKKAREELEAAFCFLAERYSKENCHVDNWILGNEVNVHQEWYYAGNISRDAFMKNYADTFRILYYAVKSNYENARVYICTDHTWTDLNGYWGARDFMTAFNAAIKKQSSKIQWNLAYHPYPKNLENAMVWLDGTDSYLCPPGEDAKIVSTYNLDVMTNYVKRNFGVKTRVIISEVGFTSYTGQPQQAAALVYSYYKAEFNDMIDAFIVHVANEGGRLDFSYYGKPAYNVYKYMNTPKYADYVDSYLSILGVSSWKDVTGNFDAKKLKGMPKVK